MIFQQGQLKVFMMAQNQSGFLEPKIWEVVPAELKKAESLQAFKSGIKKMIPK